MTMYCFVFNTLIAFGINDTPDNPTYTPSALSKDEILVNNGLIYTYYTFLRRDPR